MLGVIHPKLKDYKNIYRPLHTSIVNFRGLKLAPIFLSFIFLSWPLGHSVFLELKNGAKAKRPRLIAVN